MKKQFLAFFLVGILSNAGAINLEDAIRAGEAVDPTLAAANANRDGSIENIAIARSKILPQINSINSYQKSRQDITSPSTRISNTNSVNSQISLRQGIFRPRDWAGLSIGELQAEYGILKFESARGELWQKVVSSWIDVLTAYEVKKSQAQTLTSVELAAKQGLARYKAGDGTKDSAAELGAQFDLAKAQYLESELNLKSKQDIFKNLTGINFQFNEKFFKVKSFLLVPIFSNEEQAKQEIITLNPDLLAAKVAEKINGGRLSQAKFDHYPTVDLIGSYAHLESDSVSTLGYKYNYGQYGFQIAIPIFTGGGLSATERQVAATWVASQAEARATEQKIINQLSGDWSSQMAAIERVKSAKSLVDAGAQQKRAANMSLKSGIKSWTEVANTELQLSRREVDYLNLSASLIKSQARILSLLPVSHPAWTPWINQLNTSIGYTSNQP